MMSETRQGTGMAPSLKLELPMHEKCAKARKLRQGPKMAPDPVLHKSTRSVSAIISKH